MGARPRGEESRKRGPVPAPVRIGVIGTGAIASAQHIPELSTLPHARLQAVANRGEARAQAVAGRYGIPRVYTGEDGWRRLLDEEDIDAVVISTPNVLRVEIATAAAQAGRHLLIEKPIATSLDEGRQIVDAVRQAGVICMIGYQRRLKPIYREARRLVQADAIGPLHMIHATLGHSGPEHWAPHADWFFDPARAAGGAVMDLGIHMADLVVWLIGAMPHDVAGTVSRVEKAPPLDDQGVCTLRFPNGCLGVISVSWAMRPGMRRVEIQGRRGRIVADEVAAEGLVLQLEEPEAVQQSWRFPPTPLNPAGAPRSGVATAFVEALLAGTPPPATGEDGLQGLAVVETWYRAAETGAACAVPAPELVTEASTPH
jgi:predicted dehydrogenase